MASFDKGIPGCLEVWRLDQAPPLFISLTPPAQPPHSLLELDQPLCRRVDRSRKVGAITTLHSLPNCLAGNAKYNDPPDSKYPTRGSEQKRCARAGGDIERGTGRAM